jgi:hypothetical protein
MFVACRSSTDDTGMRQPPPIYSEDGRMQTHDPLIGGIQVAYLNANPGTLGAIVYDAETWEPYALSNQHVFFHAPQHDGDGEGRPASQPTLQGDPDLNLIGTVLRARKEPDCAIVRLNGRRTASGQLFGGYVRRGITGSTDPQKGMRVIKSGLTTNVTIGRIVEVYDNGPTKPKTFLIRSEKPDEQWLCGHGDSGAVWLEIDSMAAVGLHFSHPGTDADEFSVEAFAYSIRDVERSLGVVARRKAHYSQASLEAPALAQLGAITLVGWISPDQRRLSFAQTYTGRDLAQVTALQDRSSSGLDVTTMGAVFFCAWTGAGNDQLNVFRSVDGVSWIRKDTFSGMHSRLTPALKPFGDWLYLAWCDRDSGQLVVMRSQPDIGQWRDVQTLRWKTTMAPRLTEFQNELYLLFQNPDTGSLQVIKSSDGVTWAFASDLRTGTDATAALHTHGDSLYVGWRIPSDSRVGIYSSKDGVSWGDYLHLFSMSRYGVAMGRVGSSFAWAFAGTDTPSTLNMFLYDW